MNKIEAVKGDIASMEVDAIINAADSSLEKSDDMIHNAAGPDLIAECKTLGGCKIGEAKATKAYKLKAKNIIHTVGPTWKDGESNETALLAECYRNSIRVALENGCKTLAFPAIGTTGEEGFPIEPAAEVAVNTVIAELKGNEQIEMVYFVCSDDLAYRTYIEQIFDSLF